MHPTQTRDPARHKAALIHLVASLALVGAVLAVPRFLWYPGALYSLSGIDSHLLLLLAAVLAVGPALTWLIYRTGKCGLRMNMVVMVLIQSSCCSSAMPASCWGASRRSIWRWAWTTMLSWCGLSTSTGRTWPASQWKGRAMSWTGPVLVGAVLQATKREATGTRVVPVISQAGRATMLVDTENGQPLRAATIQM